MKILLRLSRVNNKFRKQEYYDITLFEGCRAQSDEIQCSQYISALWNVCVFVTKTCDSAHELNMLYLSNLLIVSNLIFWHDY